MKKVESHEQTLLSALRSLGKINLNEAMKLLNLSESSVRRLFTLVESHGNAIRVHGGLQTAPSEFEYSYEQVENVNRDAKLRIASRCVDMVRDGMVIYLDSGSTLAAMSALLADRMRVGELEEVTVFTNSLANLNKLSAHAKINVVGGSYRDNRKDLSGYLAEEMVKNLNFSICFLGTDGYSVNNGFTATDFFTARLNELVLKNSQERVILADRSKFVSPAVVSYSKNVPVHTVVTDQPMDPEIRRSIEASETKILFV